MPRDFVSRPQLAAGVRKETLFRDLSWLLVSEILGLSISQLGEEGHAKIVKTSLGHSLKRLRERERERGVPVLALTGTRNAEREQVSPPQAPIFWTLKDTFFKS